MMHCRGSRSCAQNNCEFRLLMMIMAPRALYIYTYISDRRLGVKFNAQQNAFLGGSLTIPYLAYEQHISLQAHCNKSEGYLRFAESLTPFQWHKFRLLKLFNIQNPLIFGLGLSAVPQEVCVLTFINIANSAQN